MLKVLFASMYKLQIICADPERFINKLVQMGITVIDIHQIDPLNIIITVTGKELKAVIDLINRIGFEYKIIGRFGVNRFLGIFRKRIALIVGAVLICMLTLFVPTRVLFISVEGNNHLPADEILERAQQVGLHFFASRSLVRNEKLKNDLLQAIPELKWVGINTYGCTAVISVLERDRLDQVQKPSFPVQGIYASRDGIVRSISVTKGTPLCKTGQAVNEGQLLISGYTDCGLVTRAEQAEGEVRGVTKRQISAVLPDCDIFRGEISNAETGYRISFGKKHINLHIGSGNLADRCGKIYKTWNLTLPGGFQLPVSLTKITAFDYISTDAENADSNTIARLGEAFVLDSMIAGKILSAHAEVEVINNASILSGSYECEELIGKIQNEEIG